MAEQENLARTNFEGYRSRRSGVNHDGTRMPSWEGLTPGVREGWEAGAAAVEAVVTARLKAKPEVNTDDVNTGEVIAAANLNALEQREGAEPESTR